MHAILEHIIILDPENLTRMKVSKTQKHRKFKNTITSGSTISIKSLTDVMQ